MCKIGFKTAQRTRTRSLLLWFVCFHPRIGRICPSQSTFVAVRQDPVSVSWINGKACRAMLTSRDTGVLAAAQDINTPMGIQHEVTERGGSLAGPLELEKRPLHHRAILRCWRKTAMEHVNHDAPDAGCVGGDCGEAAATDGIAANGLREDLRETYPFDVLTGVTKLLRALRRPLRSKQFFSAMPLGDGSPTNLRVTSKHRKSRRTRNQRIRGVSHGANMATHREHLGTHCTRKKQRTISGMHQTISRQSQLGGPEGYSKQMPEMLSLTGRKRQKVRNNRREGEIFKAKALRRHLTHETSYHRDRPKRQIAGKTV